MEQEDKQTVEFEIKQEEKLTIQDVALLVESIAKGLKTDQKFIFIKRNKRIEIKPSNELNVEIEYEVEGNKHSFEIEVEWYQ